MARAGFVRFTDRVSIPTGIAAMELHHLRTFVAVAEEGHLTRAAERLFTSQPAISAHIKALEEELDVALFERTPRGMQLTAAGGLLLDDARRTLAAAGELLQRARGLHDQLIGSVRIGLNNDAGFLRLPQLQVWLQARHPRLELEFVAGSTAANVPQLRVGRLDAAFISGERVDPLLAAWALCDEELAVAVPARLQEAVGDGAIAALASQPWVYTSEDCPHYQVMLGLFAAHACRPARTLVANQEDAVAAMVRAGVGLGILRREQVEAIQPPGAVFALPRQLPRVKLRFALLARRADDPLLRALLAGIAAVWELDLGAESAATPALPRASERG